MFSRVRIAIRFFFVGLAVGVLLAPRSGEETRRLVREKADRLLNDVLDAATLGTAGSGTSNGNGNGSVTAGTDEAAPKQTRSRSRTRATETEASTAGS